MDYATAFARLDKALTAVLTFDDKTVLSGAECDALMLAILEEMTEITISALEESNQHYVPLTPAFKAQKGVLDRVAAKANELESALLKAQKIIDLFKSLSATILV